LRKGEKRGKMSRKDRKRKKNILYGDRQNKYICGGAEKEKTFDKRMHRENNI
jgi:hypothetical protein